PKPGGFVSMKNVLRVGVSSFCALICICAARSALAQNGHGHVHANEVFVPSATTVAFIPVVNATGEKWVELKEKQAARGNTCLKDEFTARGFRVVPLSEVEQAITRLHLDFSDEEQRTRTNM